VRSRNRLFNHSRWQFRSTNDTAPPIPPPRGRAV
jgi:hypothetical protein